MRTALALVVCLPCVGCYLMHDPPGDAGLDAPDVNVAWDAGTDAGLDAGQDAALDAGEDAGPDAGDPDSGGGCIVEPSTEPFEGPVPELIWSAHGQNREIYTQVCMTPLVIETDRIPEGAPIEPEVVFTSYANDPDGWSGVIRIIDPRNGETRLTIPSDEDEVETVESTAHLAAGDLDGDGLPEIVAIRSVFGSTAYRVDGSVLWESTEPSRANRGSDEFLKSIAGAPAIADLDADGSPEVIFGRVVLDGLDGSTRWIGTAGYGISGRIFGPMACPLDIDGDGTQEVIAGNTAYDGSDGSIRWEADVPDGMCAVGDVLPEVDGPEIVLTAGGTAYVLSSVDGHLAWEQHIPGSGVFLAGPGPATVADFDADGRAEIAMANGMHYVLIDADCRGNPWPAECIDDGIRWSASTEDDSSSSTGSSVFDFNGDGASEAVYNDEHFFRIYDGSTGSLLFQEPNSSRTRTEYPVIADVDGDGNAEIIFPANNEASFLDLDPNDERFNAGIEIWGDAFDRWVGTRRVWNQHAYSIDNVEEDGTIPARPAASWSTHNSYRANRLGTREEELSASDLYLRLAFRCDGDRVLVTVTVRNLGITRVLPGIRVALYDDKPEEGGRYLGEVVTTIALEGGGSQDLTFATTSPPGGIIYGVVDQDDDLPDGRERECNEGNNRRRIRGVRCP